MSPDQSVGILQEELERSIQVIIDQPSSQQSDETIKLVFNAISAREPAIRAKAFSALALILQNHPTGTSRSFRAPLESLLHSTRVQDVCNGLSGLSAILLISPQHGLDIIQSDGFLSSLAESVVDLLALGASKKPSNVDLIRSFSEFIALALNHQSVREIIRSGWPGCVDWLAKISLSTAAVISLEARSAASLALIKLRLAKDSQEKSAELPSLADLTRVMLNAYLENTSLQHTAVEGLALVSQNGLAREILMKESEALLRAIKGLSVSNNTSTLDGLLKSNTSAAYGVATILAHLSTYQVIRTDEDQAADKLKKLAQRSGQVVSAGKISAEVDDDEDKPIEDATVFQWVQESLKRNNDLMDIIGWLVRCDSKEVKRTTGKLLLNLVERQECRGIVLQCGGGRMLMKIIATLTMSNTIQQQPESLNDSTRSQSTSLSSSQHNLDPSDLHIIQALAKILITTNPLLIFGPSPDSPILLSTIKPLAALFVHPSSTLLQTFEALMALTNLTSLGARIASEVATTPRVFGRLEECTVGIRTGENVMVRRAATELLCNLSSTQFVLKSFGALETTISKESSDSGSTGSSSHITRLHLLIALSSSEDLPTALAASGSLAILTEHANAICEAMLTEHKLTDSLTRIVNDTLEEGRIGVQYRLISIIGNLSTTEIKNPKADYRHQVFNPALVKSLNDLIDKLGDQDQESLELKKLTRLVIQSIEKNFEDLRFQTIE